ncbi:MULTISPECIES: Exc2 family lipoprotein [Photorhabdus]|uniref:Exc2 family lipoprotein n=1 Tax=Photorhabdus TaxID=29487 RepID=UPI0007B462FA|nr:MULTISPECIES: Exc2 family lipoprotein [Photorhabdus]AXG42917.1 hypothetical protein PluDJC_12115 [Photorhabdus laumondii subsp. laumondii]MBS9437010.1 hypothetical protein [Photorhabdus noenieputensis]MCC8388311.1 Exc2 family lipoprotein [Photorhabdus laumondii]MCK3670429.1 Exc2 family lipoprotein [Photorhabdus noenieputensis]MCZ1247820.1 hypothetical protein [Photorhabdus laumondii subsp. laumondii]
MRALYFFPIFLFLSSCSINLPPYEREARHYVYRSNDDFDPNFETHVNNSIKLMTPFFEQFYREGVKDRMNNISSHEFEKKINYFKSDNLIQEIGMSEIFISPKIHTKEINNSQISNKKKKALINGIINSYEAGYYGK